MTKIVDNKGEIFDGDDANFDNAESYLENALSLNNWTYTVIQRGNSGYIAYKLTHPNEPNEFIIHTYLKPIKWRSGRSELEKQHQMQGNVDMRGYDAVQTELEKTYALGIYKDPTSEDYLICAWNAFDWGLNKGQKPFNYNIRVNLLSKAFKFGFEYIISEERKIFAFKPAFIHYYLLNSEKLHKSNDYEETNIKNINTVQRLATNKIYFGCPGTGKSYQMKQDTEGYKKFGTTLHPEYDYAAFIGSYKPKMDGDKIMYDFTPQIFTKAYVYAYQNPNENVALVIEEINRGNCALIFGDIFQLLDRKSTGESEYDEVTPDSDLASYLESELGEKFTGKLVLPSNLSILATMNTSDQSLFPMDSAFKRRWEWQYIPINLEKADEMAFMVNEKSYNWKSFLEIVNDKIYKLTESEDKQIGTFFVSDSKMIQEQQFKSKVMFYLWFDIFKNEIESEHNIFRDKNNKPITFSDLFKERADENLLESIMTRLGLTPIDTP